MNEKSRKQKEYEMRAQWNSLEWRIKEKLISIDNMTRQLIFEMKALCIPESMIADFLPQAFAKLKEEVVQEQSARHDTETGRTRTKCRS